VRHKRLGIVSALVALGMAAVVVRLSAQTPAKPYTAPRAADGHADISGVWEHNAATPLQRPAELNGRALLKDEELAAMERKAAELFNGDGDAAFEDDIYLVTLKNVLGKEKGYRSTDTTGNYNHFWITDRWFEKRTSLITDPPDGRLPEVTAAAKARAAAAAAARKGHEFDGPETIHLDQRCVTGNVPMIRSGYNNFYQIVQSPQAVAVNMEMRHDTRMIPIGNRPHLPKDVQFWLGDPIGRWEGDTFVVDTMNIREDSALNLRLPYSPTPSTHLVERFTRTAPNLLKYEVTITDPEIWTRPFTVTLFMRKSKDQIYEYACHEGNEAMSGTLRGERVQDMERRAKQVSSGAR
jgi:hypothetical protein